MARLLPRLDLSVADPDRVRAVLVAEGRGAVGGAGLGGVHCRVVIVLKKEIKQFQWMRDTDTPLKTKINGLEASFWALIRD